MGKKKSVTEPSKLSPADIERIEGWLARLNLVRQQAAGVERDARGVIDGIAGDGFQLEQREDGVWRVPRTPKE